MPPWQDYHELRATDYPDELSALPIDTVVNANKTEQDEDDWDDQDDDNDDDDWEKEEDCPGHPAWYRFHDRHGGSGRLRHLPNVRGDKQRYYTELYLRHRWLSPKPAPADEPPAAEPLWAETGLLPADATPEAAPPAEAPPAAAPVAPESPRPLTHPTRAPGPAATTSTTSAGSWNV